MIVKFYIASFLLACFHRLGFSYAEMVSNRGDWFEYRKQVETRQLWIAEGRRAARSATRCPQVSRAEIIKEHFNRRFKH